MRTAAALLMLSLPRSNVPSQVRSPEKLFPVESFLYAFFMLSNHLEPQPSSYISTATWRMRAFHAFQSLRLSRKSRFLSKTPPFLFQLSGTILLPQPLALHPQPRLARQASGTSQLRHSPCPKSFPVDISAFPFPSSWNESLHPALIHSARSAISDLPPSQPNIPFIEPPAAPFLKISTRPGRARAGFFFCISSSAGIFHLFPAPMRTPSRSHFQKSGIQNALLLPLFPPFLTSQNTKNSGKLFACRCFCVGVNLSSQAVSSQVLSAPVSLTSVFDMGTGGPSL